MSQPAPFGLPDLPEVPSMTVWPSIAATRAGRLVGRMVAVQAGIGRFFTLGKLLALAAIPIALAAYAWRVLPYVCRRYQLTNRRVVIRKGLAPVDEIAVDLDGFDAIAIERLPGQQWLRAGDVIFRLGDQEVFRLPGVPHPESFRQTCLKARTALISVREVLQKQAVGSG